MTTYRVTSTISSAESEREHIKRDAARAVYAELLKYYSEKSENKTA